MKLIVKKFTGSKLDLSSLNNTPLAEFLDKVLKPKSLKDKFKLTDKQFKAIAKKYGIVPVSKKFIDIYNELKDQDEMPKSYKDFKIKNLKDVYKYLVAYGSFILKEEFEDYDLDECIKDDLKRFKKFKIQCPEYRDVNYAISVDDESKGRVYKDLLKKLDNLKLDFKDCSDDCASADVAISDGYLVMKKGEWGLYNIELYTLNN